ncbi:hypothetical protein WJX81_006526 [Elliptochloris bilobata]|uniref:Serine carboxypeptidase n=1 Tax=Elliptochloris bilobata TaxID=381761 RepID=A0AAW1RQJ8_9CHLO
MGLIDLQQRAEAEARAAAAVAHIKNGSWADAQRNRQALLDFLTGASGVGTLLDTRRAAGYDHTNRVRRFLNQAHVKEALGVPKDKEWIQKSEAVKSALIEDVMRSVAPLFPDLLAAMPVLLYQGATDAQDGPATNEPWIRALQWHGQRGFNRAERRLWRMPSALAPLGGSAGEPVPAPHTAENSSADKPASAKGSEENTAVVGYWRQHDRLTHVVVRNAGHMSPGDQPWVAKEMIEARGHFR